MVVTVKKSIWKQNKVVALRVRLIPMCVEFIYIYMCLLLLQIKGYIGSGIMCSPAEC